MTRLFCATGLFLIISCGPPHMPKTEQELTNICVNLDNAEKNVEHWYGHEISLSESAIPSWEYEAFMGQINEWREFYGCHSR